MRWCGCGDEALAIFDDLIPTIANAEPPAGAREELKTVGLFTLYNDKKIDTNINTFDINEQAAATNTIVICT